MTPKEKAYEEALRRIRKAEKTGAVELDLKEFLHARAAHLNRRRAHF